MRVPGSVVGIDPATNLVWFVRLRAPIVYYTIRIETRTVGRWEEKDCYDVPIAVLPASVLPGGQITPEVLRGLRLVSCEFKDRPYPQFEEGEIAPHLALPEFLNVMSPRTLWRAECGILDLSNPQLPRYAQTNEECIDTPRALRAVYQFDGQRWEPISRGKLAEADLAPFRERLAAGFLGQDTKSIQMQHLKVADYVSFPTLLKTHRDGIKTKAQVKNPISIHEGRMGCVDVACEGQVIVQDLPAVVARAWYERYVAGDRTAVELCDAMVANVRNPLLFNQGLFSAFSQLIPKATPI